MQTTIAILAGGQSRRMGTDKATLQLGGRTLLERAARTALATSQPVVIVGRERPDGWPLPAVTFLPDAAPGRGPLGGLHTALRHVGGPVLALACDLPLLTADALTWLLGQVSAQSGPHGLAVLHNGRWEPLFSAYDPACLPLIESLLESGRLSLHGLIEAGDFGQVETPAWAGAQLVNVNTLEDLELLTKTYPAVSDDPPDTAR